MAVVDDALYVDGHRVPVGTPPPAGEPAHATTAWLGLLRPTDELAAVATRYDLHPLAVEDAGKGHQRAKLERYGQTLFVVLRPA